MLLPNISRYLIVEWWVNAEKDSRKESNHHTSRDMGMIVTQSHPDQRVGAK
ncbi:hypothetical protein HKD21_10155 [Gluconobacter cerevisiae]|uniref:Uncharacterized protein n=1 Tax=Gluconobacter cerevisiae TaxID=1379734 RepID=A0ABR9YFB6_9PROT|nr:hypothetical protein [Gluconobacter cerevisiae]MBF0877207.1 hypothetical protein [Gluconobacter cerevisiae]